MSAERRAKRGISEIVRVSSGAESTAMLAMFGVPSENVTTDAEFQTRPLEIEGQLLGTLRHGTSPNVGYVLRPGLFTVLAFREPRTTGPIAHEIWAISHGHAAHKALKIEQQERRILEALDTLRERGQEEATAYEVTRTMNELHLPRTWAGKRWRRTGLASAPKVSFYPAVASLREKGVVTSRRGADQSDSRLKPTLYSLSTPRT